jgi:hypothetical protein
MARRATRPPRATPKRLGGVQRAFVSARAIVDDVLQESKIPSESWNRQLAQTGQVRIVPRSGQRF